jgi:hypothetical protein
MKKTFRVSVDDDVKKKYFIHQPLQFAFAIMVYLNDPDGWAKHGFFFEPVTEREDILIRLSSPRTIAETCGLPKNLSCAELGGANIYLNADRWFHGSKKSGQGVEDYRQYMVSHEVGHILGHGHKKCPCVGCKAPIMMQQTKGIGKCVPNIKVDSKNK